MSITRILTSIVTLLASIEQVNTRLDHSVDLNAYVSYSKVSLKELSTNLLDKCLDGNPKALPKLEMVIKKTNQRTCLLPIIE